MKRRASTRTIRSSQWVEPLPPEDLGTEDLLLQVVLHPDQRLLDTIP